jgi:WhiB family transcriptional regulator, redox-sensing transcriptional regulator
MTPNASRLNTVRELARRPPRASRFDAEAAALSAGPAGRWALGAYRRRRASEPESPSARRDLPCQVHGDPDLWFADAPDDLERAKALCWGCPVQLACLTAAIERREPTGVWGGQILDKGEIVTHKRSRGRPRKGSSTPQRHPFRPVAASVPPTPCPDGHSADRYAGRGSTHATSRCPEDAA